MLAQGSADEAIERFRTALSTTPNNKEYRLTLGSALVQGEHLDEAALYLNGILKSDPDNGPANLAMGRVEARNGTLAQTIASYHKAMSGVWPKGREQERQEVPLELADYLFAHGAQAQAALELVGLAQQSHIPVTLKERAGRKLLAFHQAMQALSVFQEIVHNDSHDGNAWAGLGEAQFDLKDYQPAEESLKNAVTWGSVDDIATSRLQTVEQILALDPSMRGLTVAERYRRSLDLLQQTLDLAKGCKAAPATGPSLSGLEVRAAMQLKQNRPQNTESIAENVNLAEDLWQANQKWC